MSVKEIKHGNAIIIIYRPTLTEEEQKHSEKRISATLQQFGKEMQRAEGRRKRA